MVAGSAVNVAVSPSMIQENKDRNRTSRACQTERQSPSMIQENKDRNCHLGRPWLAECRVAEHDPGEQGSKPLRRNGLRCVCRCGRRA